MTEMEQTQDLLLKFRGYLILEEKSANTIEKYLRDIHLFFEYLGAKPLTKEAVIAYKSVLQEKYKPRSVNSMLASINRLFDFLGRQDLKVKSLKLQQQIYCAEEKELTKAEYNRLCMVAKNKKKKRLYWVLQTICATGIRVSELHYITLEAVKSGEATVSLKGKTRTVFIVSELRKKIAPLCSGAGNRIGYDFYHGNGKSRKPN